MAIVAPTVTELGRGVALVVWSGVNFGDTFAPFNAVGYQCKSIHATGNPTWNAGCYVSNELTYSQADAVLSAGPFGPPGDPCPSLQGATADPHVWLTFFSTSASGTGTMTISMIVVED